MKTLLSIYKPSDESFTRKYICGECYKRFGVEEILVDSGETENLNGKAIIDGNNGKKYQMFSPCCRIKHSYGFKSESK